MSRNHPTVDPNLAAEIEACSYLSLRELREPKDNAVTLVLDEAIIGATATNLTLGDITLNEVRNIEVTRNSRAFELLWDQYVAYSVRNESFSLPGKDEEIASGHWLRIYRKSHFLDYLNKATWGDARHPGPVTHFGIICLNHVIDVASVKPPKIRLL
jgi:hypothetical protein